MWRIFLKMEIRNKKNLVEFYMESFQENDHKKILSCLTDDVEWQIYGHKSLKEKKHLMQKSKTKTLKGNLKLRSTG